MPNHESKIKEKYEEDLLKYPNVVGVETGLKEVDGEETDEIAIIVKVTNKVPESELEPKYIIPKEIEGVKTDVINLGSEISIPPFLETPMKERTDKHRPCPFGVSIAHVDVTAGTQGALLKKNDQLLNLSNAHVKANTNKGGIGDPIDQPGPYDQKESGEYQLEELEDSIPIHFIMDSDCSLSKGVAKFLNGISKLFGRETRFEIRKKIKLNEVDAALGKPIDQEEIAYYVLGPKKDGEYEKLYHRGSRGAEIGENVWTSGRTLGYRGEDAGGRVKSKDATIQVRYPSGIAVFKNQIHIESEKKFSAGGMSGSAVSAVKGDKIVGLLFAGNQDGTHTYCNPIGAVEEKLNAEVVDMNVENNKR